MSTGTPSRRRRPAPLPSVMEGVMEILATHSGAATVTELTRDLGISTAVFYRWMEDNLEFRTAVQELRARADQTVESALYRRAVGYTTTRTKPMKIKNDGVEEIQLVEYPEEVAPEVSAQRFWLTNRQPERWAERAVVDDDEAYQKMLERAMKTIEGKADGGQ